MSGRSVRASGASMRFSAVRFSLWGCSNLLKPFIADVSHDFRTPLSVIRLNLELLRRISDSPKQQQRIDVVAAQEQHLTRLLTDMTVMLSLDEYQGTFNFKLLDLN